MLAINKSLANLSNILRHRDMWPEGFRWYFGTCQSCAMGLAFQLWGGAPNDKLRVVDNVDAIARLLEMPEEVANSIFNGLYDSVRSTLITPEMVADAIDEYLALEALDNKKETKQ